MSDNNKTPNILELVKQVGELTVALTKAVQKFEKLEKEFNEYKQQRLTVSTNREESRKLSNEQVREIFNLHVTKGMTGYSIAKQLGENSVYVYNILNRKIYSDVDVSDIIAKQTVTPTTK